MSGSGALPEIEVALDHLREVVQRTVRAEQLVDQLTKMRCTVSVGWATSVDAQGSGKDLTQRSLRGLLETAVAEAKLERNRVLRYDPSMEKSATREGRADCGACRSKFTLIVAIEDKHTESLRCPNCGNEIERPVSLRPES